MREKKLRQWRETPPPKTLELEGCTTPPNTVNSPQQAGKYPPHAADVSPCEENLQIETVFTWKNFTNRMPQSAHTQKNQLFYENYYYSQFLILHPLRPDIFSVLVCNCAGCRSSLIQIALKEISCLSSSSHNIPFKQTAQTEQQLFWEE